MSVRALMSRMIERFSEFAKGQRKRLSRPLRDLPKRTSLARRRGLFKGGLGFFVLTALAGLGVLTSLGIARAQRSTGGTYTLVTSTEAYLLETVTQDGITTTRLVPVRRVVRKPGTTETLPGGVETLRVETKVKTVTQAVTVRVTETVVATVIETVPVTVTEFVPVTVTETVTGP